MSWFFKTYPMTQALTQAGTLTAETPIQSPDIILSDGTVRPAQTYNTNVPLFSSTRGGYQRLTITRNFDGNTNLLYFIGMSIEYRTNANNDS
jgi:hypothetical protein